MSASSKRLNLILSAIVFGAGFDQITKWLVEKYIPLGDSVPIISNFFHLTHVQNKGIVFGMYQGENSVFNVVGLMGLAIIGYIAYYLYTNFKKSSIIQLSSYGLILGGAIGNSIDRFARGFVIDFIDFRGIWGYIFNGADTIINIGIALLIVDSYLNETK